MSIHLWTQNRPSENPQRGFVYLAHAGGHNVYKIGCTVDLARRISRLQAKVGSALVLKIVDAILYNDYTYAEGWWHTRLQRYHLCGEWFALPDSVVADFIRAAEDSRTGPR